MDDDESTPHVQSMETRLASLLKTRGQVPSPSGEVQQDPSTSDSVEHDNSLANTMVSGALRSTHCTTVPWGSFKLGVHVSSSQTLLICRDKHEVLLVVSMINEMM